MNDLHSEEMRTHDWLLHRTALVLGTSLLFPFYCYVTSSAYLIETFGKEYMFLVNICHNVPNFCMCVAQIVYLRKNLTCDIRMKAALLVYLLGIIIMPILILCKLDDSEANKKIFKGLSLGGLCMIGSFAAVLQGTLFSIQAQLGPSYLRMAFVGNAGAGLLTGVLRVMSLIFVSDKSFQSIIFFFVAAVFIIFCMWQYVSTSRAVSVLTHIVIKDPRHAAREVRANDDQVLTQIEDDEPVSPPPPVDDTFQLLKTILPLTWKVVLGICLTFALTLNIFPGVVAQIPMRTKKITEESFSLLLVLLYLSGDFLGRMLTSPAIENPKRTAGKALIFTCVRIPCFVVIFWVLRQEHNTSKEVDYLLDAVACFMVASMSITNGIAATKCMSLAPQLLGTGPNAQKLKEMSGLVMTFALTAGIMTGAVTSLLWGSK